MGGTQCSPQQLQAKGKRTKVVQRGKDPKSLHGNCVKHSIFFYQSSHGELIVVPYALCHSYSIHTAQ